MEKITIALISSFLIGCSVTLDENYSKFTVKDKTEMANVDIDVNKESQEDILTIVKALETLKEVKEDERQAAYTLIRRELMAKHIAKDLPEKYDPTILKYYMSALAIKKVSMHMN